MDDEFDDRDLIECFNAIYELYPRSRLADAKLLEHATPSISESRDAMRLFARIDNFELRTALRMLLRTLAATPTSADPSGHDRPAASKPN